MINQGKENQKKAVRIADRRSGGDEREEMTEQLTKTTFQ